MIDIILNTSGGLIIAHDQRDLDRFTKVEVDVLTRRLDLVDTNVSPPERHELGILDERLAGALEPGVKARIVRFSGASLARMSGLMLEIMSG